MDTSKWEAIQSLDLKEVGKKLKERKGRWWKWRNDIAKIEKEYRQFLYLIAVNPNDVIVPWSEQLDDFWHEHILDTQKYDADCKKIFGKFVHHNPHLTKGSSSQKAAFNSTKRKYTEAFGHKSSGSSSSSPGCSSFVPIFVGCGSSVDSHACADTGSSCGSSGGDSGGSGCGGGGCGGGGD